MQLLVQKAFEYKNKCTFSSINLFLSQYVLFWVFIIYWMCKYNAVPSSYANGQTLLEQCQMNSNEKFTFKSSDLVTG